MSLKPLEFIESHWAEIGLTEVGKKYVIRVIQNPPSREPSNVSGRNMIVDFASRKMGHTVATESATIEAAFAVLLEARIECIGYYPQPEAMRLFLPDKRGVRGPRWLTFDFLAIYHNCVELIECKRESYFLEKQREWEELRKLGLTREPGPLYRQVGTGEWISPAIKEDVVKFGLEFRVITEPQLPTVLIRNYDLLLSMFR